MVNLTKHKIKENREIKVKKNIKKSHPNFQYYVKKKIVLLQKKFILEANYA